MPQSSVADMANVKFLGTFLYKLFHCNILQMQRVSTAKGQMYTLAVLGGMVSIFFIYIITQGVGISALLTLTLFAILALNL